jgi:uncharacterized SAM-binding protein YcdF (DUF218 family)
VSGLGHAAAGALATLLERPLVVRGPEARGGQVESGELDGPGVRGGPEVRGEPDGRAGSGESAGRPRRFDAIVVLGAPLGSGGTLTAVLEERIAAAAALWRAGAGGIVVATGGGVGPRPEAAAMAEGLRALGVPDVLVEPESRTTAENARLVAALLAPRGARSAWLVTQPFHGRRAARLFRAEGLDAHAWHIADSLQYRDRPRALRWLAREYAAWAKHLVRGGR